MPTNKPQHNVVLDAATERAIWRLVGLWQCGYTTALRRLLATHPEVLAQAESTPDPDSIKQGGKRDNAVFPKTLPVTSFHD